MSCLVLFVCNLPTAQADGEDVIAKLLFLTAAHTVLSSTEAGVLTSREQIPSLPTKHGMMLGPLNVWPYYMACRMPRI